MRLRPILAVALAAALALLSGCVETGIQPAAGRDDPHDRHTILASTAIVADWVSNVAGDLAEVTTLVPAGVDPHLYDPVPADVRRVAEASIVFKIDLDYEGWLDGIIANAGGNARVVAVSDGANLLRADDIRHGHDHDHDGDNGHGHEDDEHEHDHDRDDGYGHDEDERDHGDAIGHDDNHGHDRGEFDPHVWMDVANAIVAVNTIAAALAELDPDNAATYRANAAAYMEELEELDGFIRAEVATIPEANRKLVMDHHSLEYFARAYGLESIGAVIPAITTDREPSAAEASDLVRLIRAEGVPAIFAEAGADARLTEMIAAEAGVTVVTDLYVDVFGPEGSEVHDFVSMMRHNVRVIVDALR